MFKIHMNNHNEQITSADILLSVSCSVAIAAVGQAGADLALKWSLALLGMSLRGLHAADQLSTASPD